MRDDELDSARDAGHASTVASPWLTPLTVLALLVQPLVAPPPAGAQAEDAEPLSLDQLFRIEASVGGETPRWSPDGSRLLFVSSESGLATYRPSSGETRSVPVSMGGAGHFLAAHQPKWSTDGEWISFVSTRSGDGAPEIWLWSTETGEQLQLTNLGARLINAYSWSPDGERIAFSADRYGQMDVWTVSVPDGRIRRLTTDSRYEVFPFWTPDAESILYVRLDDRWVTETVLRMAADGSGKEELFRDSSFFDYDFGGTFGYPRVSPDGDRILFRSQRSGWMNLWTVPLEGGEPRQVAAAEAEQSHGRWSPDGDRVAFVSNRNGTQNVRVAEVDGDAVRTVVDPDLGMAGRPEWSPDGSRLSYTLQSPTRPLELHTTALNGSDHVRVTASVPEGGSVDRLIEPRKIRYESTDGFSIPAYLYAPRGASASDSLPGILWIHGGPTSQWSDEFLQHVQYIVQRGYVVLLPNIRGSSGYGKAFAEANNRCWGHCDLDDVRAGVEFLRTLDYVDDDRMGITGTSYGGVMTMSAVAYAPGLFQAAVSQSGYGDWVRFQHGRDEINELRHMKLLEYEFGPFEDNREVWVRNSPTRHVENATTPTLLVHGEGRHPESPQSEYFYRAMKSHYKVVRHKSYPGETYYVYGKENRKQMVQDIRRFLDQYLKGPVR